MKKLLYITIMSLLIFSCEKDREEVEVMYRVSNSISEQEISYMDVNGSVLTKTINLKSEEDIWSLSLKLERGEIVYLSAVYADSTSSVKAQILINGKIYKEKSSDQQPDKYVTVSGTIPF